MNDELTVTEGSASILVKRRTVRSDMLRDAIYTQIASFMDTLTSELGIPANVVNVYLARYGMLGARCEGHNLDFPLPLASDSADELKAKFMRFMDSAYSELALEAEKAWEKLDRPVDPVLAPHVVDLPEKNVSSARRSKTG